MTTIYSHPVTVLDTATSSGLADVTACNIDYRGLETPYSLTYVGTMASVGTGDTVRLQVSNDGSQYAIVETFATTQFSGVVNGPWSSVKFTKQGSGTGTTSKVVVIYARR